MLKRISTFVIAFLLFASTSFAFLPLVIPMWVFSGASALGHASVMAGLYYLLKPNAPATVDPAGSITRPANAVWVDLNGPTPMMEVKDLKTTMPLSKAQEISEKLNPDGSKKYPDSYSALHSDPEEFIKAGSKVGETVKTKEGNYALIVTKGLSDYSSNTAPSGVNTYPSGSGTSFVQVIGAADSAGPGYKTVQEFTVIDNQPKPTPTRLSSSDVKEKIAPSGSLNPLLQAEFDKMFADPSYVPVFNDANTGGTFTAPIREHVATPSQLATYNANGQAAESASNAAQASQQAATNAANQYVNSGGNLSTGQGGDAGLYQAYLTARANAAASQATADALVANQTYQQGQTGSGTGDGTSSDDNLTAPPVPSDNTYDTEITAPEKKSIGQLLSTFVSGSPLVSMVKSFTISTSNATGVVPIGNIYGQELTFDFTRWESTLRACGGVLILIMHGFAIFIVVRGW